MRRMSWMDELKFDEKGLIPAVVQDAETGQVLMLAYMNRESVQKTLDTGMTWFFSRSRQALWNKGETSGNVQKVRELRVDCDADTLLVLVEQTGVACHTGAKSCFFRSVEDSALTDSPLTSCGAGILDELYGVVRDRMENPKEGSYTNYLLDCGIDKILKKVGEECSETIIAAKNEDPAEIAPEASDLLYHLIVMIAERGMTMDDIYRELQHRR